MVNTRGFERSLQLVVLGVPGLRLWRSGGLAYLHEEHIATRRAPDVDLAATRRAEQEVATRTADLERRHALAVDPSRTQSRAVAPQVGVARLPIIYMRNDMAGFVLA